MSGADEQGSSENNRQPSASGNFTGGGALLPPEPRPWKPFAAAGLVILLVVGAFLLLLRKGTAGTPANNPGGANLAQPAAYAESLPISDLQMSDSTNLSGGREIYLDGMIRNTGSQVVRAITVQTGFKDVTGLLAGKQTLPLTLIRFREPYVDTEPVSAEPIRPGESRSFRLIFDAVPQSWDGAYPEVRVISVSGR